jgi:hypothetical protein
MIDDNVYLGWIERVETDKCSRFREFRPDGDVPGCGLEPAVTGGKNARRRAVMAVARKLAVSGKSHR